MVFHRFDNIPTFLFDSTIIVQYQGSQDIEFVGAMLPCSSLRQIRGREEPPPVSGDKLPLSLFWQLFCSELALSSCENNAGPNKRRWI